MIALIIHKCTQLIECSKTFNTSLRKCNSNSFECCHKKSLLTAKVIRVLMPTLNAMSDNSNNDNNSGNQLANTHKSDENNESNAVPFFDGIRNKVRKVLFDVSDDST